MMPAEQRISEALNSAVDRINPDLSEKILTAPAVLIPARTILQRIPYRRAAALAAGLVIIAAAVITAPRVARLNGPVSAPAVPASSSISPASPASSVAAAVSKPVSSAVSVPASSATKPAPPTSTGAAINGVCEFLYYEYAGNYYSFGAADPAIQKNIEKSLDTGIYKIKGEDPAKSLAIFINQYYHRLTYAFPASLTLNGTEYLLSPDEYGALTWADSKTGKTVAGQRGALLGKTAGFSVYAISGVDTSKQVAVDIGRYCCNAYAAPACVQYGGKTYWLQARGGPVNIAKAGNSETPLGSAGAYKVYKLDGYDPSYSVMVHLSATEEMRADAVHPATGPLPESLAGSVFESMGPCYAQIDWSGHGFYYINGGYSSDTGQAKLAALVGESLGSSDEYPIYRMIGVDPSKAVLAKNNQVWMEYDYIYPDEVSFEGAEYIVPQGGDDSIEKTYHVRVIRGAKIGMAGSYTAYAIQGIDPSRAIIVMMHGKTAQVESSCTITFIRK